jgi:pilus assembly protein CpaB
MQELRKKMMAFLGDENGIFKVEYDALGLIIVLGILVMVTALTKKGKWLVQRGLSSLMSYVKAYPPFPKGGGGGLIKGLIILLTKSLWGAKAACLLFWRVTPSSGDGWYLKSLYGRKWLRPLARSNSIMRQLPGWLWLVLAIAFAGMASYMALGWLKRQAAAPVAKERPRLMVVVANAKVGPGGILTPPQLKTEIWQRETPPQDFFSNADQVVGREARTALNPGDLVTRENTGEKRGGIIAQLSPNQRAMTVKVDEASGVAGFLVPGDRVDVVVILDKGEYNKNPISKTLIQNLKVLGTGQKMEPRPGDKPQVVPTVTLEVSPEQGESLALATKEGRISLVLRGLGDQEVVETQGVDTTKLLGGTLVKATTAAPPPSRTVEVIRRTQRASVSYWGLKQRTQ